MIWETNLRQSYNAGREEQMADPELRKRRPYGLYRHGDSAHPRPMHLSWNGITLPLDDPWWSTHTPQNGWGCKCKKFMLSARDVERQGLKIGPAPEIEWEDRVIGKNSPEGPRTVRVPKGIDPGFEYAPGRSRLSDAVPPMRAHDPLPELASKPDSAHGAGLPNRRPSDPLPPPRSVPASQLLPTGLTDDAYVDRFLSEFGAKQSAPALFKDVTGDAVVIGRDMFTVKRTGQLKVKKRGREQTLLLVAQALREPDEVWVRLEPEIFSAPTQSYKLVIVEVAAMQQVVSANQLLDELNRNGFIALYINFDTGKAELKADGQATVAEIVSMLKAAPALRLAIEGHTDSQGQAEANKLLSEQRAQSVMNAIVAAGIEAQRLTAAGFGQERPVADNRSEEGRAKNRRVELVKL